MVSAPLLPLTVCADDFGLAAGIDAAILDLAERRRLTAVSCMVLGESWPHSAPRLRGVPSGIDLGLHFTLTHLPPAGPMPRLAPGGRLPGLATLIGNALIRRLDDDEIAAELARQIALFTAAIGRPPDFVDGHQHVHQLPGVRDAVFQAFRHRLAGAWLRYPAMPPGDAFVHRVAIARTWVISALGHGFREAGAKLGIAGNGAFRGVRDGGGGGSFAALFRRFVRGLSERPLVMCHPGFDGDPFVTGSESARRARRDEHAFLTSNEFLDILADNRLRLAAMSRR